MTKNKWFFASDFHLGVPNDKASMLREIKICEWLERIKNEAEKLFLVGDIFDFWFEYKHVVPKGYLRFLGKIAELSDNGTKIYFFKGNHDVWMFDYFEKQLNVEIISNELIIEKNNYKFFIHHGDGLGPGDKSYKFLKNIFRNKIAIWAFKWLHPDIGAWIAKTASKNSRISQNQNDKSYLGDDKEFLTLFCKEYISKNDINFFIFGHRHLPIDKNISEKSRYINLGEWVNDFTFAEFDGEKLELKTILEQ